MTQPTHNEGDEEMYQWEDRHHSMSFVNHIIAGSLAGYAEHCLMLPADIVKTNMQVYRNSTSMSRVVSNIWKKHGFRGFWHGIDAVALGCVPAHAAYFSMYELSRQYLKINDNRIHALLSSAAGAIAAVFHDAIYTPFDVIKQRQQLHQNSSLNAFAILRKIIREEGVRSLFRSLPVTVSMNIPNAAVIVGVNDSLKVAFKPKNGHNFISYFLCAGIAGATAALITIPLDVIKTKMQTQHYFTEPVKSSGSANSSNHPISSAFKTTPKHARFFGAGKLDSWMMGTSTAEVKYKNFMSTIQKILAEEGIKGFFKGALPRMIVQAPSAAISWATYETIKHFLFRFERSEAL
jgi:solute carrier family 25 iron transporter 28/37